MKTAGRSDQRCSSPCTASLTSASANIRLIQLFTPNSVTAWASRLRAATAIPPNIDGSIVPYTATLRASVPSPGLPRLSKRSTGHLLGNDACRMLLELGFLLPAPAADERGDVGTERARESARDHRPVDVEDRQRRRSLRAIFDGCDGVIEGRRRAHGARLRPRCNP